jgi:putative ABC transport system permease protein
MSWLSRCINVFRSGRVTDELDQELQFHLESRARDLMASGLPRDEAFREAARRLGNAGVLRERSREVKLLPWLDAVARDLRMGLRMLRRDLLVSAAAITSLALAIGGCSAAFALVDALILRPLPVRDPGQLVSLAVVEPERTRARTSFNYPLFERLRGSVRGRLELAAFSYQSPSVARFDDARDEERVYEQFVSGNAFGLLGVPPALGRVIVPADDTPASARHVAVLSHGFWTRRFGADPRVIGRTFTLGRSRFEIVGVARKGFTGIEPGIGTSFWVPLTSTATPAALGDPGWHWFKVVGRVGSGEPAGPLREAMQAALSNFRREQVLQWQDAPAGRRAQFLGARLVMSPASNGVSDLRTDFERPLWILTAVVGLVFLLACSNLANLMLARAAAREREMALRLSIGAGRARLIQQMLVEAGAIAVVAAAVGAAFARIAAPAIVALLSPWDMPAYLDVRFDGRALAFAAAIGAVATIAFGLMPALRASSVSPLDALKATGGRYGTRAKLLRPLVATQVAVSLAVLFLGGLLLTSFARLSHVNAGFVAEGVTLVDLAPANPSDRRDAREAMLALISEIRSVPHVAAAGLSRWALFSGAGWNSPVRVNGHRLTDVEAWLLEVTPGFMETMRIRLLAGRDLSRGDLTAANAPVLVNETFARLFLPGSSPLGRQFARPDRASRDSPEQQVLHEVVGVVADAKYNDLRETTPPTIYLPLRPPPTGGDDLMMRAGGTLAIRSDAASESLTSAVRAAAARVTPPMKVGGVTLQSTLVTNTMLRERLLALLSGFFALVSLALAAVGLYGVLSYSVVQQTREIGIRMALGAPRRTVVRQVVAGVVGYVALGTIFGLAAGLWLSRFVTWLLYESRPSDPSSILLPLALLLLVAIVASALPARRAATVDPIVALRDE